MGKIGKLVAGALAGLGIGLLVAPKKGSETRKDVSDKLNEVVKKAKNVDNNEVMDNLEAKIRELKEEIKDLDKEKALDIAKEKSELIKEKVEDLAVQVKDKATPVIESSIEELRKSAIKATKEITKKLEGKDTVKKTTKSTKTTAKK